MAPRKKQISEESTAMTEKKTIEKKVAKTQKASIKVQTIQAEEPKKKLESIKSSDIDQESKAKKEIGFSEKKHSQDRGALILGGGLLVVGLLLLIGRMMRIPFEDFLWPFIFIIPGVLIFLSALVSEDRHGEGLSILGSILTMLGLVFLAQSLFDFWASWAYAWALVVPTSVGLGQMIYGVKKDRESIVQAGKRLVNLGVFMFCVGFVFFELIIGISGFGLSQFGLPVFPMILIFAGLFVLIRSIIRSR